MLTCKEIGQNINLIVPFKRIILITYLSHCWLLSVVCWKFEKLFKPFILDVFHFFFPVPLKLPLALKKTTVYSSYVLKYLISSSFLGHNLFTSFCKRKGQKGRVSKKNGGLRIFLRTLPSLIVIKKYQIDRNKRNKHRINESSLLL